MLGLLYNMPRDVLIAQLKDGLVLLVLGMGTVFVFLVILIYATKIMSKLCKRCEPPSQCQGSSKAGSISPGGKDNGSHARKRRCGSRSSNRSCIRQVKRIRKKRLTDEQEES